MAECSLKLAWDIKKDRHAALVMINANRHEIEFEGCLHNFIRDKSELAKKAFDESISMFCICPSHHRPRAIRSSLCRLQGKQLYRGRYDTYLGIL